MKISAVILTKDEEIHLSRCLDSIKDIVDEILIVDSYSNDRTQQISNQYGCKFYQRMWKNYSNQFSFGQSNATHDWILRIDADEIIDEELKNALKELKKNPKPNTNGFYFNRFMFFEQKPINYGGLFPVKVVRLFKKNFGQIEQRWMDEHIIVDGKISNLPGRLIDNNLNDLNWWKKKHLSYANREAFDLLSLKYNQDENFSTVATYDLRKSDGVKRLIKEKIYNKLPLSFRSKLYFFYRFFLMLGFLDLPSARRFHWLQGYWYRNLVDSKIERFEESLLPDRSNFTELAKKHFGIDI